MRKHNTILIIGGALVLILIIGAVVWNMNSSNGNSSNPSSSRNNSTGTPDIVQNSRRGETKEALFDVSLKTLDGDDTTLAEWKGEPMVVNIWATWCPFCTDELPAFAQLQKTYSEDLTVIAVNRRESTQKIREYLSSTSDIAETDLTFLRDPQDQVGNTVNRFSMPETLFVAPDGTIVFHRRGPLEFEQMKTLVEAMDSVENKT